MYEYDITKFSLDGISLEFDKGYLMIEDDGYKKDWKGELFGVHPGVKINSPNNINCEIVTESGETFAGTIIIPEYLFLPLGDRISFKGNGPLRRK